VVAALAGSLGARDPHRPRAPHGQLEQSIAGLQAKLDKVEALGRTERQPVRSARRLRQAHRADIVEMLTPSRVESITKEIRAEQKSRAARAG
jgi:hypothetical protein